MNIVDRFVGALGKTRADKIETLCSGLLGITLGFASLVMVFWGVGNRQSAADFFFPFLFWSGAAFALLLILGKMREEVLIIDSLGLSLIAEEVSG